MSVAQMVLGEIGISRERVRAALGTPIPFAPRVSERSRQRPLEGEINYRGRKFTPDKDGYYRATTGDRAPLHHLMWREAYGEIPAGHELRFINRNLGDVRLANLECLPKAEIRRKNNTGLKYKKRGAS